MIFPIPSEADTAALARKISTRLEPGTPLLLKGPLGAGKTFLARGIIGTLAPASGPVPSPSFSLLQTYDSPKGPVSHFDLYRLESAGEVFELDFDGILRRHIVLIEWPEIVEDYIKTRFNTLEIQLSINGGARTAEIFLQPPL
jgi:tRNA threonylcarbamoyl adenosine modification protein YjeE